MIQLTVRPFTTHLSRVDATDHFGPPGGAFRKDLAVFRPSSVVPKIAADVASIAFRKPVSVKRKHLVPISPVEARRMPGLVEMHIKALALQFMLFVVSGEFPARYLDRPSGLRIAIGKLRCLVLLLFLHRRTKPGGPLPVRSQDGLGVALFISSTHNVSEANKKTGLKFGLGYLVDCQSLCNGQYIRSLGAHRERRDNDENKQGSESRR